ncbi:MAG: DegT/DnrJ/EryC1/StrS family aminotransferase [Candidatus Yanofskybacteria bacterium]|nr:DegT/DnrJ/EryC1/StrS family aminotransferase [Candidatus Yanofskybacteria bacterium]
MENHPFVPGKDKVYYSRAIFGDREIASVLECLNNDWLGVGKYTRVFEKQVAEIFGQKFALFVNSGSSANFLAVRALLNGARYGEVITPACTFATTVNPLIESGLVPVFVDVEPDTYNVDLDLVEEAINPHTVGLMIPHLIGNLNDMARLRRMADEYGLMLIEDSCDSIGGTIRGEPTGKYADASTTSFYASHIITAMGGGGMVMFKNQVNAEFTQTIRDWGRASAEYYDEHPDIRFNFFLDDVQYDGKFVFRELGFNFKALDPQAAFGLVQLSRLSEFDQIRKRNFKILYDFFAGFPEHFMLPRQAVAESDVRWLAYPLIIRESSPIKRTDLMLYMEERNIQTRVLFAGNILRHPPYKDISHFVHGNLTNSDMILAQGILIGCHHGLRQEHLDYVMDTIKSYLQKI